jgi:hypothetical protein
VTSRPSLAAAFVALLVLSSSGCRSAPEKKPEDQLFEARQEYRQTLDGLYRAYGGTYVPGSSTSGSAPQQDGGVIGHVVSEADRSYFERQCLAVGRGERPFSVSAKLQRFLDGAENASGCRKSAQLQEQIRQLEARVAKP